MATVNYTLNDVAWAWGQIQDVRAALVYAEEHDQFESIVHLEGFLDYLEDVVNQRSIFSF